VRLTAILALLLLAGCTLITGSYVEPPRTPAEREAWIAEMENNPDYWEDDEQ